MTTFTTCLGAGREESVWKQPVMASTMKPMMRMMMNGMMTVNDKKDDPKYDEVSNFMVPKMFNPEDKEKWAKFLSHRPYCVPGYESKAPKPGDVVPDGPLLSITEGGAPSTLLAEAKKLAAAAGSSKVVLSFDSITCPFWRTYGAEDLFKVTKGVPTLHVYIREAHPEDQFSAHGPGMIALKRDIMYHKTEADRRQAAKEGLQIIKKFEPSPTMFMDGMDDKLEKLYEARPWRQYVIDVSTGKMIDGTSLTPFNMAAKIAKVKKACA